MIKILKEVDIQYLVVHCSDTDFNWVTSDIHKLHVEFGWDGIGYHKVIEKMEKLLMEDQNIGLEHM